MAGLLKVKILILFLLAGTALLPAQQWKPAMDGFLSSDQPIDFKLKFRPNGPLGREWAYGRYLDEDSLTRCVAYRKGGKWKSLPFHGYSGNEARDIEMYGDTMYIIGSFGNIVMDKDSSTLSFASVLKWYNDSLWPGFPKVHGVYDVSVKGDSLLIWGDSYYNPPQIIFTQFMTPDRGTTWQYPYSIIHPTGSTADFGAYARLEILENGDILTLNNSSTRGSPYSGLTRWDGQQWHSYGNGLFGSFSRAFDFEFYKGELYMGGTFNQYDYPPDPGNFIVRWDGQSWQSPANGTVGYVDDLFVHDSLLYCRIDGGYISDQRFGDAAIPFFAAWDGHQWCGTPTDFGRNPGSFGFANDTLFVTFNYPTNINGDTVSYINYYDGDYVHGPNAICSTLGLGEEEEVATENLLQVYPNPARGSFSILLPEEASKGSYILYSLKGQRLLSGELNASESKIILPEGLRGIYLVELSWEGNVLRKKLVVE